MVVAVIMDMVVIVGMIVIMGVIVVMVMVVAGLPAAACNAHQSTSNSLIRNPSPAVNSKSNPPHRGQGL